RDDTTRMRCGGPARELENALPESPRGAGSVKQARNSLSKKPLASGAGKSHDSPASAWAPHKTGDAMKRLLVFVIGLASVLPLAAQSKMDLDAFGRIVRVSDPQI